VVSGTEGVGDSASSTDCGIEISSSSSSLAVTIVVSTNDSSTTGRMVADCDGVLG
jgi:hypothetical protein